MERELKLIYAFLKDVEAIEEPDARLKFWEEEMRGIAQEAEAIIGKYKNNMRVEEKRFFTRLASKPKNLKADSKVVKKISKIKKKIQGVTERRISYGIVHVEASNSMTHKIHQRRPPSQYSEESDISGFEDHVYEITERLLTVDEPRHCVISIVGMEGSGKTTLAKSIYNKNAVHFSTCAWVSISEKNSAEEILQDIRKQVIGSYQEPKGKRSLKEELKKMLQNFLREKRYLIVLDNIAMAGVWNDLKDAFPGESNGSRIVITTRDMPVAPHDDSRIFQYKLHLRNFEIPTRRLITLWVAEGFLRLGKGDKSPEHFVERCLMELIDRNMIQVTEKKPNGKVRTCCLPGALRKLLSKAVEDKVLKGQVNTTSKSSSSLQHNCWIVDHYNNTEPSNTIFNHIHGDNTDNATLQASYGKALSFMSFDYQEGSQSGEDIENFLQRYISYKCFLLLRVLDLERVFRPQLPKVLSKLALLRYLVM
nr:disease resistance protein RPP13-like [Quercus suber]